MSKIGKKNIIIPKESSIKITAEASLFGKTGVEMEALTAVSVAGLTIYDMCKSIDREMILTNIKLIHKSGGKSGEFNAVWLAIPRWSNQ